MNKPKLLTIAAIAILAASNVFTACLLVSKSKTAPKPVAENVIVAPTPEVPAQEATSTEEATEDNSSDEPAADDLAILAEANKTEQAANYVAIYATSGPNFVIPSGMKRIKIDWADGEAVAAKDFLTTKYKSIASLNAASYEKIFKTGGYVNNDVGEYGDTGEYITGYFWSVSAVGTVASSSDKYAGQKIYRISGGIGDCEGVGCGGSSLVDGFVVADEEQGQLFLLSRYSSDQDELKAEFGVPLFTEDKSAYIAELENPNSIDIPGSSYKLYKSRNDFSSSLGGNIVPAGDIYIANASNGKRAYLSGDGCFSVYNENGGQAEYELNFPFALGGGYSVLDVTFKDGSKNKSDYIGQRIGGCGSFGCANLVPVDPSKIEAIGKFANGDTAYGYVDLQDSYNSSSFSGEERMTLEAYAASHPYILWKMPIDGYCLSFENATYMPAVECAKPVIYLYPKKEIDVKVQVTPSGGFSITDPIYGADGWLVKADTESNLYNYADGKEYPYLFWEGKAFYYQRPAQGFVMAREDVDKFLDEKLAKLGLVGKEIADFKEFWAPKMADKPYYFVTFLPQNDFNKIAPMNVSPRPQTVIRVFMDYQGLDNPITVQEPIIKTPARRGFTVVEWGGALNKN